MTSGAPFLLIKGCLEMMPDIDPSVTRLRNISLEKTTQLRSLTTNLFNISRFEEGQIVLDPNPQDLDSLLSSAVTNYEPKASQKSLELRYNCPACMTGRVCMVAADKFWLGQLIQNLMDNAMKFTPEGGVVTVSLSIDGTDAVMAFSNTGPGIQRKTYRTYGIVITTQEMIKPTPDWDLVS